MTSYFLRAGALGRYSIEQTLAGQRGKADRSGMVEVERRDVR